MNRIKNNIYTLFLSSLCLLYVTTITTQGSLSLQIESNFYAKPTIQWSFPETTILNQPIQFKTAYSTSRLEASQKNILKIDHFSLSTAWTSNQSSITIPFTLITTQWRPYIQLTTGYKQYEIESPLFDFLDNTSFTTAIYIGSKLNLKSHSFGCEGEIGYNLIQSGIVNPITITLGAWIDI